MIHANPPALRGGVGKGHSTTCPATIPEPSSVPAGGALQNGAGLKPTFSDLGRERNLTIYPAPQSGQSSRDKRCEGEYRWLLGRTDGTYESEGEQKPRRWTGAEDGSEMDLASTATGLGSV